MSCSEVGRYDPANNNMKKIIISFDGTGGEASWGNQQTKDGVKPNAAGLSNISKMHLLVGGNLYKDGKNLDENGQVQTYKNQMPLYYQGVGTWGDGVLAKIKSAINLGSMTHIYNKALKDLEKYYKKKDELYVFGFSRGAATARLFCSYLQRHGLKVGGEQIKPKIKFLGVYDTVPAAINRGIFNTGRYQLDVNYDSWSTFWQTETNMPEIVEKAVHLVAVDEQRVQFRPTLFNQDDNDRVTEIWCAGNHSDVGGGYYFDGLSDGALNYMKHAAEKAGLEYRTITSKTDAKTLVGPGGVSPKGTSEVVAFDQDMVITSNPCDTHVHNENISYFKVVSQLKGFVSRDIVQVKNDVELDDEPILVLDNVIDRVKDAEKELKEPYRPLNLMGKKYSKVNSKTGSISDKVYRMVNSVDGTISEEVRVNLNGTKQSWIKTP